MLALISTLVLAPGRIGHATRAQIMAVLPSVLKGVDAPDPAGESRYARLEVLGKALSKPEINRAFAKSADARERQQAVGEAQSILIEVEHLLAGSLRKTSRSDLAGDFPKIAYLKLLAKTIAMAASVAADQKDKPACARYLTLGLQLSDRVIHAGGGVIDLLVADAIEAIAEHAALESDARGGLDSKGQARVLGLLPELTGPRPEMGKALRGDFMVQMLPMLIDPINGAEVAFGSGKAVTDGVGLSNRKIAKELPAGNYDPIATARLMGRIYSAIIADSQRSLWAQSGLAGRLARAAGDGIPDLEDHDKATYRARMNAIPNSIGRQLASFALVENLAEVGAMRTARRNLTRAAILLRHGNPAIMSDPFGKGPLKINPKRRIVYSLGKNGRDDGGQIGKGLVSNAPDFGCRY